MAFLVALAILCPSVPMILKCSTDVCVASVVLVLKMSDGVTNVLYTFLQKF